MAPPRQPCILPGRSITGGIGRRASAPADDGRAGEANGRPVAGLEGGDGPWQRSGIAGTWSVGRKVPPAAHRPLSAQAGSPVAQLELDQDLASRAPRAPARRRRWPPLPKETRQLGVAGYSGGARHFRGLGATCGRGAAERVQRRRIRPLACAIRALFDKELTPHPRESGKPRGVNRRLVPRANCMSRWEVLSAVIRRPLLLLLLLLLRLQLQWTLRHVGPVLTHFHHRRE